ncbi:MAG: DoxX family membrane protein, partial [Arenibacter algicola]|nr:DoxX family membrane protein [Arenibacter algicola]MDX1769774.1 DoxX family membrane protein [Arenibacter troitsensis]
MATIKSLNKWANAHTYYPLDLLRVALGVFL